MHSINYWTCDYMRSYFHLLCLYFTFHLGFQFPQHAQQSMTVVDSKLLLLNHPRVRTTGCVWQLRLCQWPCELTQRHSEGGCWNAEASVCSTGLTTRSTAAHVRYNSQACMSWERSWTSLMIHLHREQSLSDCCSDVEVCCEEAAEMIPGSQTSSTG